MSTEIEKPLHVQVAEALGWTQIVEAPFLPVTVSNWLGKPPAWDKGTHQFISGIDYQRRSITVSVGSIPRYDTDWSATGPLIEQLALDVFYEGRPRHDRGWTAQAWLPFGEKVPSAAWSKRGETPLLALCKLILALHAAGKLRLPSVL